MKVIILAAGQGKRLRPITDNIPKSLVKLGDKTIIEHSLDSLSECGIKDVIIVSGFYSDKMKALLGDYYKGCRIKHCVNEDYANNDNMFSMWVAKDEITEDIMYFNADVICNSEIIKNLINSSHKNVIVIDDINPIEADHMKVRIEEGKLKEIRRDLEDTNARAIGMYKLCLDDARKYYSNIEQLVSEGKIKSKIEIPMTMMFPELEIHALSTGNNTWFEIDDINDLRRTQEIMHRIIPDIFNNYDEISRTELRGHALDILSAGVNGVKPKNIIPKKMTYNNGILNIYGNEFDISKGRLFVIGGGKASGALAEEIEKIIPPELIAGGIVNSKTEDSITKKIQIVRATHPIPGEIGIMGVNSMLGLTMDLKPEDIVICLISGGGSSLMPSPVDGITLDEKKILTDLMIKSGAETYEINIVRKHLSKTKGGQLARHIQPAKVIGLIIQDALHPRDDTASGPTCADQSTFTESLEILRRYNLINEIPISIKERIEQGVRGNVPETVKSHEPFLSNVNNHVLLNYKMALDAMKQKALSLGYEVKVIEETVFGKSRDAAQLMGKILTEKYGEITKPFALICNTETTVSVKGSGKGGRNQQFIANIIPEIRDLRNCVATSIDSDGIDYLESAGGAIADNNDFKKSEDIGLNVEAHIKDNNTYELHKKLNNLLIMKTTNTNVGDLQVYLIDKHNNLQ